MLDNLIDAPAAGGESAPAVSMPAAPKATIAGLAIVGSNPNTVGAAPYGDPSWKILSCSPDNTPFGHSKHARALPRTDEVFECHLPLEDPSRPFGYLKYLSEQPFVWLRDQNALKHFKGGRLYPERELRGTFTLQEVEAKTGTFRPVKGQDGKVGFVEVAEKRVVEVPNHDGIFDPCQFTSSIAFILAKAIIEAETDGIPMIGMWGIMQASENEYAYQRPGIQYFIHEAMKRGIKVVANRESCLFDMPQWKW